MLKIWRPHRGGCGTSLICAEREQSCSSQTTPGSIGEKRRDHVRELKNFTTGGGNRRFGSQCALDGPPCLGAL